MAMGAGPSAPGGVRGSALAGSVAAPRDCAKEIWERFETKDWVPSQSAARMKNFTTEMKKISPAPTDLVSHKREQDTVGSRRSSQTLLLRRKYVLWRCALVFAVG